RLRPPPCSTLFPYTTLFRSVARAVERIFRAFEQHRPARVHFLIHHRPHRFALRDMRIRVNYPCHINPPLNYSYSFTSIPIKLVPDRKSTRLNSSHDQTSYAV